MRVDERPALATTTAGYHDRERGARRRFVAAGILLGLGLGGFIDGIVLHQILQWHHMLTDYDGHSAFPDTTVSSLEENTLWDGLFHASTWVFVAVGLFLLWQALSAGYRATWRSIVGLLLAGWGIFNLLEGSVDHHILTIHHVRDDVEDPLWWDLGFLAFGAVLLIVGLALRNGDRQHDRDSIVNMRGDASDEHVHTIT
jgi:uncharacterized membrane protein